MNNKTAVIVLMCLIFINFLISAVIESNLGKRITTIERMLYTPPAIETEVEPTK